MKNFIAFLAIIAVVAVCSCQPAKPKKTINVVFGPGICEYSTCEIDYDYYLNKPDTIDPNKPKHPADRQMYQSVQTPNLPA